MIVYILLLTTLLLAIISILLIWHCRGRNLTNCWYIALTAVSLAYFIYLFGAWVFLSVYAKYVFAALFLAAATAVLISRSKEAKRTEKKRKSVNIILSALLLSLCILYYTGTAGKPYGVANMAFPFRHGTYFVFQGGKGLPANVFHFALRGAVFAMDIIKLNRAGNRANHIFSKRLEDYATFGDTIYSPCNGRVLHTADENPDNIPPNRQRGPSNTNHVLIESPSYYVFLGHMKQQSVFVREGDSVTTGQPLGLAGNSGFSLEPHLHIQAHAKTASRLPWYKQPPLQIAFDGKTYLLFEEIPAK